MGFTQILETIETDYLSVFDHFCEVVLKVLKWEHLQQKGTVLHDSVLSFGETNWQYSCDLLSGIVLSIVER